MLSVLLLLCPLLLLLLDLIVAIAAGVIVVVLLLILLYVASLLHRVQTLFYTITCSNSLLMNLHCGVKSDDSKLH